MKRNCTFTPASFRNTFFDSLEPELVVYPDGEKVYSLLISDEVLSVLRPAVDPIGFRSLDDVLTSLDINFIEVKIIDPDTDEVLSYSYYFD